MDFNGLCNLFDRKFRMITLIATFIRSKHRKVNVFNLLFLLKAVSIDVLVNFDLLSAHDWTFAFVTLHWSEHWKVHLFCFTFQLTLFKNVWIIFWYKLIKIRLFLAFLSWLKLFKYVFSLIHTWCLTAVIWICHRPEHVKLCFFLVLTNFFF